MKQAIADIAENNLLVKTHAACTFSCLTTARIALLPAQPKEAGPVSYQFSLLAHVSSCTCFIGLP